MKLEKREITLNEQDSLKDVFYWEYMLLSEYEKATAHTVRKETYNVIERHIQETKRDGQTVEGRLISATNGK